MIFINKKLFKEPEKIFDSDYNFGWLLLGKPTNNTIYNITDQEFFPAGDDFPVFQATENPLIYDCTIAGISNIKKNTAKLTENGTTSITYEFEGATASNSGIVFISPIEDANKLGHDIQSQHGRLAYVKYKKSVETADDLIRVLRTMYREGETNQLDGIPIDRFVIERQEDLQKTTFQEDFIEDILLVYDVNNTTEVNTYNFTGFSVGKASFSVSGLSS